jgi:hypothetical protein
MTPYSESKPSAQPAEVMHMRICEATRLVLRLGQPYVFTEDPECPSCKAAADRAREAYGPDGGAPLATHPTPAQEAPDSEYEVRDDGKRVRKDRWQFGIRRIVALLWGNRHEFEIDDVVEAVRKLVPPREDGEDPEGLVRFAEMLANKAAPQEAPETGWMRVYDGDSLAMLQAPDGRIFGLKELGVGRDMWGNPDDNDELVARIAAAINSQGRVQP